MNEKGLSVDALMEYALTLLITAVIALMGNFLFTRFDSTPEVFHTIGEGIPGMGILYAIGLGGLVLAKISPIKMPFVIWITLLGVLIGMPYTPVGPAAVQYVSKVEMLPLATPVLVYAGIGMGRDLAAFKKVGWHGVLISALVITGTFVGAAVVAEVVLRMQGII